MVASTKQTATMQAVQARNRLISGCTKAATVAGPRKTTATINAIVPDTPRPPSNQVSVTITV